MSQINMLSPYLPTRLSNHALRRFSTVAAAMILGAEGTDKDYTYFEFLFKFATAEINRRDAIKDGNFIEPAALELPEWTPMQLSHVLVQSRSITYLSLEDDCAEFVDWVDLRVTLMASAFLRSI